MSAVPYIKTSYQPPQKAETIYPTVKATSPEMRRLRSVPPPAKLPTMVTRKPVAVHHHAIVQVHVNHPAKVKP
jgi:hypothetical protein